MLRHSEALAEESTVCYVCPPFWKEGDRLRWRIFIHHTLKNPQSFGQPLSVKGHKNGFLTFVRNDIFYFLLNFFPRNSIKSTIPIQITKQITAHKIWLLSHEIASNWFGRMFFQVTSSSQILLREAFQGQILFKEPSINPVNEARVIIL